MVICRYILTLEHAVPPTLSSVLSSRVGPCRASEAPSSASSSAAGRDRQPENHSDVAGWSTPSVLPPATDPRRRAIVHGAGWSLSGLIVPRDNRVEEAELTARVGRT